MDTRVYYLKNKNKSAVFIQISVYNITYCVGIIYSILS